MTRRDRLPIVTIAICVAAMALVAAGVYALGPSALVAFGSDRTGRTFYIPTESMLPTLEVNDRILPRTIAPKALRRGMVVVFQAPSEVRVDRIAGIGGDEIALRGGVVIVNGSPSQQRALGAGPTLTDGSSTRVFAEQFPGEAQRHYILDAGPSPSDDAAPIRIPPGFLYVLGDDRDRAADSRYPAEEYGVGLVPVGSVIGQVDTLMWAADRGRIGQPIDAFDPMTATRS